MRAWLGSAFLAAVLLQPTFAIAANTADTMASKLPVNGGNGSFTRAISIDVPDFHGIEPDLRLTYDSTSGIRNLSPVGGELGIGWTLRGVSAIQRVSGTAAPAAGQTKQVSGRGAPNYGAAGFPADSFVLDGTELVSCTEVADPSSSPSCATGGGAGSWTSRVETYLRIRQNTSSNTWEVTGRDGTRSVYTSLEGQSAQYTYRWHLSSVIDSRGNHVDYGWSCNYGHCTIASIRAYSQGSGAAASEILFHMLDRPDPLTYGTGLALRAMTKRITAIEIRNAGLPQSVYALTYATSASTGLSRLIEVRKYGSDAAISGEVVTGGTSLPPFKMTYSDNGDAAGHPQFTKSLDWTGPGIAAIKPANDYDSLGFPIDYPDVKEIVGDFDGDGWATDNYLPKLCISASIPPAGGTSGHSKPAYVCVGGRMRSSDGNPASSTFELVPFKTSKVAGKLPDSDNISGVGDFDGDLNSDFARAISTPVESCPQNSCARTWAFNGIGQKGGGGGAGLPDIDNDLYNLKSAKGKSGDFDGDGKDDFLLDDGRIAFAGKGKVVVSNWGLNSITGFRDDYDYLNGDFNGDGRSDTIIHKKNTQTYRVYISTGSSFLAEPSFTLPSDTARQTLADVNGDGLTDLIYSTSQQVGVMFSNGSNLGSATIANAAGAAVGNFGAAVGTSSAQYSQQSVDTFGMSQYMMGDFNGDGRADIAGSPKNGSGTGTGIARSIGTGFESQPSSIPGWRMTTIVADYNGDGADDIGRANLPPAFGDPRLTDNYIWLSNAGQPDLMTSFQETSGGKITVTYGSSARETASALPFIMQLVKTLTLDDGRGTATSLSSLSFSYEGGLWSKDERQFMGFSKVKVTLPCVAGEGSCPQQVLTYDQTPGCHGEVLQDQTYDGPGGGLLSQKTTVYQADAQLPYTCLATASESRIYSGSTSRAVRKDFSYDLYGNATQVIDYGVVEAAGDETFTLTSFAPNTSDYLVSCPAQSLVYQGISAGGTLLSGTRTSYDGSAAGQPPSRCEKTQQDDWTSGSDWITSKRWGYDPYGNPNAEVDGVGNTTATIYDGTFGLYPVETQLPGFGLIRPH